MLSVEEKRKANIKKVINDLVSCSKKYLADQELFDAVDEARRLLRVQQEYINDLERKVEKGD